MPLTQDQKTIITQSVPFLEEHGVELTSKFYSYMLEKHPEVRPYFNKAHQIDKSQPRILAFALVAYAKNIEDLTPLLGFVRQIVEKHVGLQVQPGHYDIVGSCLLHTLSGMLGELATPEFIEAWKNAYYDLANLLIGLEKERYAEVIKSEHAWAGFKAAKVVKLVEENKQAMSVYMELEDGHYATPFPGQYICIKITAGDTVQSREFTLSNELSSEYKYYRLTVKRQWISSGVVSTYIHDQLKVGDTIQVSAPYGKLLEPTLKSIKKGGHYHRQPVVLFVGGIGVTPSLSIVEFFLRRGNTVDLFISFSDLESRVFQDKFEQLLKQYSYFHMHQFISHLPQDQIPTDVPANFTIKPRRMVASDLNFITQKNANRFQYFMIGPKSYMDMLTVLLPARGVDLTKMNTEQFGPVGV